MANIVARRQANEVRFTFQLPTRNQDGSSPINLERVEIFAATVAAGAAVPSNRELLTPINRTGAIDVKPPPPPEGEEPKKGPQAPKKDDPRPGPGETVTFSEELTDARLRPTYTKPPPEKPATEKPAAVDPSKPVEAAPQPPAPTVAKRIYAIRGVARGGRPGQPTTRYEVPLTDPPPPPGAVSAKFSEAAITLAWLPPVIEAAAPAFNVYLADTAAPLNPAPLATPAFDRPGIEFGKEECFVVRTVQMAGNVAMESVASERACTTPTDTFPPAAPTGLAAVAGSGVVSLIWAANSEPDLAGYVVLRGEMPGDKLQPLTPSPIRENAFRDTTAKAGVRYVYAVVAVDRAAPPNSSAPSARVEETAR
jgi:hypothetical protein